jgi:hypothetical protein
LTKHYSGGEPVQYQALRSVSDNHVFVVCRDGCFYELPGHVRHRGPWQGLTRGDIDRLKPEYWLDLTEHGYVLVKTSTSAFQPEV